MKQTHHDNITKEQAREDQHDSLARSDRVASSPAFRARLLQVSVAGDSAFVAHWADAGLQQYADQSDWGHHR